MCQRMKTPFDFNIKGWFNASLGVLYIQGCTDVSTAAVFVFFVIFKSLMELRGEANELLHIPPAEAILTVNAEGVDQPQPDVSESHRAGKFNTRTPAILQRRRWREEEEEKNGDRMKIETQVPRGLRCIQRGLSK